MDTCNNKKTEVTIVEVTPGCVLAMLITISYMMAVSACACETAGILIKWRDLLPPECEFLL
jgi:hypothetical protein